MSAEMLQTAKEYTAKGWVVHPLSSPQDKAGSPGKRPLIKAWQELERTPENIEEYINKGCNIGLQCGKRSGIIVLDFDHALFKDDIFNSFDVETLISGRTAGRGHIYFKHTPLLKAQKHHDLGIEILSDGNNAVLPPSIHASGDVYKWKNPNAPIIEMPEKVMQNLNCLFNTEAELKTLIGKCRHCFRDIIKRKPDVHGNSGREYMIAICTDLKAKGAEEQHVKMFAKIMYGKDYDEAKTLQEWRNLDPAKTWKCDTLKNKLTAYIDLDQCTKCEERREKAKAAPHKNGLDKAIGFFKDKIRLAEEMQAHIPIYYDKSRNYWIWDKIRKCWERIDETDILNAVRHNSAENVLSSTDKNEILTAIQLTGRERNVKKPEKSWIQFKDVVYDIKTKNIFEATPGYFFTSPIPYAIGKSKDTPVMDRIFKEWIGEDAYKLYEVIAYCLLDDYPIHRMFWLYGNGRNGKGQFTKLITKFLGIENTTSTSLEVLIDSRFEAANLYTKKVAFIGETNFTILKNTAQLKKLTGDDQLRGEFKYKEKFDFWNTAKLIINTNSLPPTLDKTDAMYSRCVIFEFANQFEISKPIIDTIPEIEFENMALKCIELLTKILDHGEFTNEGSISEKAKVYERLSNPVEQFINLFYEKDVNGTVALWQVFEKFNLFCEEKSYRKITKNELKKIIENLYEVEKKNIGGQCWVWIYGISEKKDLSSLSKLSTFTTDSSHRESVQNTDKTDKTDNPVTESNEQICDICNAPLNGSHDVEQGLPGQGRIHKACKYLHIPIRFLIDCSQFIAIDERPYGAFKVGDIAKIPAINACALVHRKAAVRAEGAPV